LVTHSFVQDDSPVRERGPQRSLAAERSFPPLPSEEAAAQQLAPLARTLLERAAQARLTPTIYSVVRFAYIER
jgi:hypothetical protein